MGTAAFKKSWTEVPGADGSPLPHGAHAYQRYHDKRGEMLVVIEIAAAPAQVLAYWCDPSRQPSHFKSGDVTAASRILYGRFTQATVGISNRDTLTRHATTSWPDGSYLESSRSIKDKRYPKRKGWVRMDVASAALLAKEKEGSGGAVSVCYRLSNINPRFTGLASGMNKIVAKAAAKLAVPPMLITKENVELALKEYAPPPPYRPPPPSPPLLLFCAQVRAEAAAGGSLQGVQPGGRVRREGAH